MSENSQLVDLRLQLDNAITYGTVDEALELAQAGLRQAQEHDLPGEIEYFKGQIQLIGENFSQAIEYFDRAIKINPADGAAYNDRALCMVELGIIDQAIEYFNRGILAEPDYANIWHNKGWLLNNLGRYSEAVECFKKALELQPDRPVTYDNLADALLNLGDYRGALKAYRRVIELLKPASCRSIQEEVKRQIKYLEDKLK